MLGSSQRPGLGEKYSMEKGSVRAKEKGPTHLAKWYKLEVAPKRTGEEQIVQLQKRGLKNTKQGGVNLGLKNIEP